MTAPAPIPRRRPRPSPPAETTPVSVHFDRRSVWQTGWVVVAIIALALLLKFVLADAGIVLFTLILSFLASIAMEPAVSRLSRSMKRGLAAALPDGDGRVLIENRVVTITVRWSEPDNIGADDSGRISASLRTQI